MTQKSISVLSGLHLMSLWISKARSIRYRLKLCSGVALQRVFAKVYLGESTCMETTGSLWPTTKILLSIGYRKEMLGR